ncbi:MAG TPA: hypothetical protein VIO84_14385 [Candidatus Dormibacteraeota bacterium]|jgi:uncharacterized protein (TIGR00290 family)
MWSGGKDSALALDRARRAGLDLQTLLTFYDSATGRIRFHATPIELIRAQAAATGVPNLVAVGTAWSEMESAFKRELEALHAGGCAGVVLGDIHLADVRAWYEERVTGAGLEHVEPLWGEPSPALLAEFVGSGGRAVLTCVDLDRLDESWLGRVVDPDFALEIAKFDVDACGENGEYHSFAFAGPAFVHPVDWTPGERRREGRFLQLDLASSVR